MAVVVIVEGSGITREMYEAVRKEVQWEARPPFGGYLHVSAFDESGLRVTDVWENEEAFRKFMDDRLIPAMKKLGVPEPKVRIYPAHNINLFASGIQKFGVIERAA